MGRNNSGKITVRHKGGGHKKKFRKIDFVRIKDSIGIVTSIEYDPYRTAFIASVYDFSNLTYFYMIAPKNLNIGNIVKSGFSAHTKIGHSLLLMKIPIGGVIHNISLKNKKKAQLTRSAGTSAQLIEKKFRTLSSRFKFRSTDISFSFMSGHYWDRIQSIFVFQ